MSRFRGIILSIISIIVCIILFNGWNSNNNNYREESIK